MHRQTPSRYIEKHSKDWRNKTKNLHSKCKFPRDWHEDLRKKTIWKSNEYVDENSFDYETNSEISCTINHQQSWLSYVRFSLRCGKNSRMENNCAKTEIKKSDGHFTLIMIKKIITGRVYIANLQLLFHRSVTQQWALGENLPIRKSHHFFF